MTLYNKIGGSYDMTRRADPYIVQRLLYHLNAHPGSNYIDVACGSGNYTIALANEGVNIYGVDQSTFANIADQEEVQSGVKRLAVDIEKGKIFEVISSYNNSGGDYIFVVAKKI